MPVTNERVMGDALKFLQPRAGYQWGRDQHARRQSVIDRLLHDAVLRIQSEAMPDAEQDRQRSDPQGKE